MSFGIVAALAALGGGSAAVGAAVAATAVGTGLNVYGQIESGKEQQDTLEEQARQEKIAAEGRELQRRQELNKALASNIVGASMSGMTGEGTPASIALESAKAVGTSEGMIGLSEKLKRRQIRMQGKMDKGTAYTQATSTLLKSAADAYGGFQTYQANKET
jgi:alkylated DNA nucleotide flippase Atl1